MAWAAIFILFMALMNMIGGRWPDVYGSDAAGGRLIFRCILPGIIAALTSLAIGMPPFLAMYVWFAVTAGGGMWEAFGWSFDEITGLYDPQKYPRWVQAIGLWFVPQTSALYVGHGHMEQSDNRLRGIVMKGIRGLYDFLTFSLLSFISPHALSMLPLCFAQGAIYWACGRIAPAGKAVLCAEFCYGAYRGLLISIALGTASAHFL